MVGVERRLAALEAIAIARSVEYRAFGTHAEADCEPAPGGLVVRIVTGVQRAGTTA